MDDIRNMLWFVQRSYSNLSRMPVDVASAPLLRARAPVEQRRQAWQPTRVAGRSVP